MKKSSTKQQRLKHIKRVVAAKAKEKEEAAGDPRDRHVWERRQPLKAGPDKGKDLWQCVLCNLKHVEPEPAVVTRPLRDCRKGASAKTAEADVLPCANCGERLNPGNRSVLQDGTVVHVGCKKAPRPRKGDVKPKPVLSGLPKHGKVRPPEPPKPPPPGKHGDILPCSDHQGRTCIQLKRDVSTVTFVPLDTAGLHLTYMATMKFDERYKPLMGYPVEKACAHYVRYAGDYGATQDVLDFLARVVTIKPEVADMAKKRSISKSSAATGGPKNGHARAARAPGERKATAASMFQELIMQGKLTDSDIFAEVKKKFGLDDKKRGYVAWYRNHLSKGGKNPPGPKAEKGAAKAAAPSKKKPAAKAKGKARAAA